MPHTLTGQIEYVAFVLICLFALWRGDRWCQAVAVVLLLGCFAIPLLQERGHYSAVNRLFWVDGPQTTFLTFAALATGRPWLIVAAACELLCLLTEVAANVVRHAIGPYIYFSLLIILSALVFLALLWGTIQSAKRRSESLSETP